ncbi:hypothetical protein KKH56_02380 [bacterium]|nr:hypothetical protein [bacterium]
MSVTEFCTAINCIDGRVQIPVIKYIKNKYQVDYVDTITLPGPDKVLAENKDKSALHSIKKCVEISINLHGSRLIAISGHHECAGNPAGRETQLKQMRSAIKTVESWGFGVKVIGLWVDEKMEVRENKEVKK